MSARLRRLVTHKRVAATAVVVFGASAAVVAALEIEGWWVVALAIAGAVTAAGWSMWTSVLYPALVADVAQRIEERHARAVGLSIHDRTFSVINQGTHEVRDVKINAMADGGDLDEMLMASRFDPGPAEVVQVLAMPGNDFVVEIAQLTPSRGWTVGTFAPAERDETSRVRFDVAWLDHNGLRRTAVGVTDVMAAGYSQIELTPRSSSPMIEGATRH